MLDTGGDIKGRKYRMDNGKSILMEHSLNEVNNYIAEMLEQAKALPDGNMQYAIEAGFFAGVLGVIQNNIQATLETIKEIENKKEAISA